MYIPTGWRERERKIGGVGGEDFFFLEMKWVWESWLLFCFNSKEANCRRGVDDKEDTNPKRREKILFRKGNIQW